MASAQSRRARGAASTLSWILQLSVPVVPWVLFITEAQHHDDRSLITTAALEGAIVVLLTGLLVHRARNGSVRAMLATLISALILFLGNFTALYFQVGSARDFSQPLTRLDAFYFAAGVMSTAGTGSIDAISQQARAIESIEMVTAMALLLLGVSTAAARLIAREHPPR